MLLSDLIKLCETRIVNLSSLKTGAIQIGEIESLLQIETQLAETEATLSALTSLQNEPVTE